MSFVPRARFARAGRKSSSAIPLANDILLIMVSVAAICASVALAEMFSVRANSTCAASSSIAAFVAEPNATANPPMAAAAGTAAFLIANPALAPAPSSA